MSGDVTVTWLGPQVKAAVRGGSARGVTLGAHRVQAVAVPRTPLADGPLRESMVVVDADAGDRIPTAEVGSDLVYAVPQHENLHYRHRHGQAKFLESALTDTAGEVQRIIAHAINSAGLGGGV